MNLFLKAAKDLVNKHGVSSTFTVITEGVYNADTLSTTNTTVNHTVKLFKNHIKTSQYSYPNLIGKEVAEFYLVNDSLAFVPNVRDLIVNSGTTFTVENIQEHSGNGIVVMYTIVASKG